MKAVSIALLSSIFIAGCNEELNDNPENESGSGTITETTSKVDLTGSGQQHTFTAKNEPYDIIITGHSNTLTFKGTAQVLEIDLTGSNNLLTFEDGFELEELTISGSDNYIEHSESLSFSKDITGSGNTFSTFE